MKIFPFRIQLTSLIWRCAVLYMLLSLFGCFSDDQRTVFNEDLSASKLSNYRSRLSSFRETANADYILVQEWERYQAAGSGGRDASGAKQSEKRAEQLAKLKVLSDQWLASPKSMLRTSLLVREVRNVAIASYIASTMILLDDVQKLGSRTRPSALAPDKTADMAAHAKDQLELARELEEYEIALAGWYDRKAK